jgi:hypothetical protein
MPPDFLDLPNIDVGAFAVPHFRRQALQRWLVYRP